MNAIKDSIKSGRTVVGTTAGPNVDVSILAEAGYDFVLFDTQHSAWEIKQLQPSIQTMRGKQAAPLVRVAANQAYQICFALDAGARGIVVPMVNTRAEAEAAVRACRYYPARQPQQRRGTRRVGRVQELPRLPRYREQRARYRADDRDEPVAGESRCHRLGPGRRRPADRPVRPFDRAGGAARLPCDTYQRALDKIAAAAAKRGIAAGMYFIPPEMDPNFFVQKGFKFFTMPWGPWAKAGIQNGLAGIKR